MSLTSMRCPVFCSLANLIHVRSGKLGESNCPSSFDPGEHILQRHRIDACRGRKGLLSVLRSEFRDDLTTLRSGCENGKRERERERFMTECLEKSRCLMFEMRVFWVLHRVGVTVKKVGRFVFVFCNYLT